MISIKEYIKNPCKLTSIPYWKQKNLVVPANMLIVHNDEYSAQKYKNYYDEPYFRLYHNLKNVNSEIPNNVEFIKEAHELIDDFVSLINDSYTDISVSRKQLESYQKTPVYYKSLWVLLREKQTNKIIGSGIGDFDTETGELILEWIQVLPNYRKCGYGQIIVNHMLAKMQNVAQFATVSGKVNNPTNPEKLYRKCGFIGNDIWHILSNAD